MSSASLGIVTMIPCRTRKAETGNLKVVSIRCNSSTEITSQGHGEGWGGERERHSKQREKLKNYHKESTESL